MQVPEIFFGILVFCNQTRPLVPLIALSYNHQNHSKWHKWCHVRYKGHAIRCTSRSPTHHQQLRSAPNGQMLAPRLFRLGLWYRDEADLDVQTVDVWQAGHWRFGAIHHRPWPVSDRGGGGEDSAGKGESPCFQATSPSCACKPANSV